MLTEPITARLCYKCGEQKTTADFTLNRSRRDAIKSNSTLEEMRLVLAWMETLS